MSKSVCGCELEVVVFVGLNARIEKRSYDVGRLEGYCGLVGK